MGSDKFLKFWALDAWQLSLKFSNSTTELPGDSVAQLVRAWQAICQVAGLSPFLSHCPFSPLSYFYFSPCSLNGLDQVKIWPSGLEHIKKLSLHLMLCTHPSPQAWYLLFAHDLYIHIQISHLNAIWKYRKPSKKTLQANTPTPSLTPIFLHL